MKAQILMSMPQRSNKVTKVAASVKDVLLTHPPNPEPIAKGEGAYEPKTVFSCWGTLP